MGWDAYCVAVTFSDLADFGKVGCCKDKALETHEGFCSGTLLQHIKFMACLSLTLKLNSHLSSLTVRQASPVLLVSFGKDKGNDAALQRFTSV